MLTHKQTPPTFSQTTRGKLRVRPGTPLELDHLTAVPRRYDDGFLGVRLSQFNKHTGTTTSITLTVPELLLVLGKIETDLKREVYEIGIINIWSVPIGQGVNQIKELTKFDGYKPYYILILRMIGKPEKRVVLSPDHISGLRKLATSMSLIRATV